MDRADVIEAVAVSGMPEDVFNWIYEDSPDEKGNRAPIRIERGHRK